MNKKIVIVLVVTVLVTVACNQVDQSKDSNNASGAEPIAITVSAAASLADVMKEVKETYENDHAVDITLNFAGSGKLAQQIEQGAPADVFITANERWMDTLAEKSLINTDSRREITGNQLVLIGRKEASLPIQTVPDIDTDKIDQIAVGNPKSVPAGQYAQEALKNMDLWEKLKDKYVLAKDVRQVLTYTETGNTDIGFVYKSDALISDNVTILAEVDATLHKKIIYSGAVVSDSESKEEAEAFLAFLLSESAQGTLHKYGFDK
ncbi:molybdate ABC transporter substrate-binding protein [Virgibacillus sp. W0181]|uniref:molybdate ABC transporter substrate-binding protein n=1 Tax=Virgibacillus sp. W0181 TaxID=3391581 RepID=UPI003F46D890